MLNVAYISKVNYLPMSLRDRRDTKRVVTPVLCEGRAAYTKLVAECRIFEIEKGAYYHD